MSGVMQVPSGRHTPSHTLYCPPSIRHYFSSGLQPLFNLPESFERLPLEGAAGPQSRLYRFRGNN
eukprot:scaffold29749_cov49-Phaeocystis_antarctica.AAC.1